MRPVLDPDSYSRPESWYGSYYQLAIEVSLFPADEQLAAALEALWESPHLRGPWEDITAPGKPVPLRILEPDGGVSFYGVLAAGDLGDLPCVSHIVREGDENADWLSLGIPVNAMLQHGLRDLVYEAPPELFAPIDRVLLDIGIHVFARAGFLLAAIGEETSGLHSSATFGASDTTIDGFLVPKPLWDRAAKLRSARPVAPGLKWKPPRIA